MKDINNAIKEAKIPGGMVCPICKDKLFSPMDKLSISLYGKCPIHLNEHSIEENNLFKIAEHL